jgi:hypothetical protein
MRVLQSPQAEQIFPPFQERLRYMLMVLWNWTHSNLHNLYDGVWVVTFMAFTRAGLLDRNHPWVTGISPDTGRLIWPDNIVYASPHKTTWSGPSPESDEMIVIRVGKFLAAMVARSTQADPEIPQGPKRRMPHAVNYLHGPVHFNGGYILFNDFADATFHMTDPVFRRETRRFARREKRELIIVFRERGYLPESYAWCLTMVRAHLPWYANGNGPTPEKVLWGTASPYAVINPINGSWIKDMLRLKLGRTANLARPPIPKNRYFQDLYGGRRRDYTWAERFHAWAIYKIISSRGFQGNLVFTPRKRIEPEKYERYKQIGRKKWQAIHPITNPFLERRKPPPL